MKFMKLFFRDEQECEKHHYERLNLYHHKHCFECGKDLR